MLENRPRRNAFQVLAAVVAALAMLFIGWVFLASGLIMPGWAVTGLLVLWAVLVWQGVRLARAGSYRVLALPLVAAAVWLLTAWVGGALLGWTA